MIEQTYRRQPTDNLISQFVNLPYYEYIADKI